MDLYRADGMNVMPPKQDRYRTDRVAAILYISPLFIDKHIFCPLSDFLYIYFIFVLFKKKATTLISKI